MAMEASQELRAMVTVEQDFGPDRTITIFPNGFARYQLQRWPVLSIVGAQWSGAMLPPSWQTIAPTYLMTQTSYLAPYGSIVGDGAGQGPNAVLVAPGFVSWWGGRKGTLLQVTYLNGWPVCGIDQSSAAGATSIHVDDITGWWNGTAGARGTIYDPPWREDVTVTGAPIPDSAGATSGPGTLPVTALQFSHTVITGQTTVPNQTVLLTTMPRALLQAGLFFAAYYGLLRGGGQAAVVQTARGLVAGGGTKAAGDWYEAGRRVIGHYARVQF
jgi:hypothetical protein